MSHNKFTYFAALLFVVASQFTHAEQKPIPVTIQPFVSGSYQQLLVNNAKQAFVLAVWSTNCPSCMKDLALLGDLRQQQPKLKIILIAADSLSASGQIHHILEKLHLADIESWVFADDNDQKLRYEIDPHWYGEIPRTYFFNAAQQRTSISGVMSKQSYEEKIKKMLE